MADLELPKRRDLNVSLRKVRNAHDAVTQGIATAAEKHRESQAVKRHELKIRQTLMEKRKIIDA